MGYRHDPAEVLAAAVGVAVQDGVTGLTFRAVARRMGIADRTVVYYFPTKHDLVAAVLEYITSGLRSLLATALAGQEAPVSLLDACWAALCVPAAEPGLRLYVEVLGLAANGQEPYRTAVTDLTTTWSAWLVEQLEAAPGLRQDQAAAVLATLDGLLVLRVAGGADLADSALRGLRSLDGRAASVDDPSRG